MLIGQVASLLVGLLPVTVCFWMITFCRVLLNDNTPSPALVLKLNIGLLLTLLLKLHGFAIFRELHSSLFTANLVYYDNWFSAKTMKSVGSAALKMVEEVRRQFNTILGLMEGLCKMNFFYLITGGGGRTGSFDIVKLSIKLRLVLLNDVICCLVFN
nr:pyrophosphatase [Tanacetum cinerariifolium]